MTDLVRPDQIEGYSPNLTNLIVNGDFEIWQRGAGPFVCTGTTLYSADEWLLGAVDGGEQITVTRIPGKIGQYAMKASVVVNPSDVVEILQGVENGKSLEGLYLTFSMWAKTSIVGGVILILGDYTSSGEVASSYAHSGSGNWELLTVVKKIRTGLNSTSDHPHGYPIRAGIFFGFTGDYELDGASLVIGNFPNGVDFNPVSPAKDWTRCQRYYAKMTGMQFDRSMNVAGISRETQPLPQVMAAVPTLTISNLVTNPPLSTVTATPLDTLMWKLELGIGPNPVGPFNYTFDFEAEVA